MSKETPALEVMAASSDATSLPDFSEDGGAAQETEPAFPPMKRARTSIPSYKEVNLESLYLKNSGPNRTGDGLMLLPLYGNVKLTVDLSPDAWLKVAFPLNTTGTFEKPSFLGYGPPSDKPEGLNLGVVLDETQAAFLGTLDDKFKADLAMLSKAAWHPLLTVNEKYANVSCKVKIMLGKDAETNIKVIDLAQNVHEGRGWSFLSEHLGSHNFRGAKMKLSVRVDAVWNVLRKAGVRLVATHLVLVVPDHAGHALESFDDNEALIESLWI